MANYLIQPDGSNTCCDCPERASPCDDCVQACQTCGVEVSFDTDVDYFSTITIQVHTDGSADVDSGCGSMSWNVTFDPVSWTREARDFGNPNGNPTGAHFNLFCPSVISQGGSDECLIYFDTPSGNTTIGSETQSENITPCTGGDAASVSVGTIISPSVTGQFISVSLGFGIACFSGLFLVCNLNHTYGGSTAFPSRWQDAPGIYVISGTETPTGWTINWSVTVTFS